FLFKDSNFRLAYFKALNQLTEPQYLRQFFLKYKAEIESTNKLLSVEFTNRTVDTTFILSSAAQITNDLPRFKQWLVNDMEGIRLDTVNNHRTLMTRAASAEVPLRVYEQKKGTYLLENNGGHRIWVAAYTIAGSKEVVSLESPISIGVDQWQRNRTLAKLETAVSKFLYVIEGDSVQRSSKVMAWPAPKAISPRQQLSDQEFNVFWNSSDSTYRIPKGVHHISTLVLIPADRHLTVEAGAELILGEGAGIISESAISMKGTGKDSIIVRANSFSNYGITVLQVPDVSAISYTSFIGLGNLDWSGWTQTGAVNFYESVVELANSSFTEIDCEDALNIIRSDFKIDYLRLENVESDGVDCDFSGGTITNSTAINIGNDAYDFSGSAVEVRGCSFSQVGDKAISCGEKSEIHLQELQITAANVAVAAKDLSKVKALKLSVSDCAFGFVAYNKKTEYGGATISQVDCSLNNVGVNHDIEYGSTMFTEDTVVMGQHYSKVRKY
ncbi:MAG: hypothetical protein QF371_00030, partial [Flavobacteriales bacterium]|nr:hypothetical protein [Flavobacteriales bacterium]